MGRLIFWGLIIYWLIIPAMKNTNFILDNGDEISIYELITTNVNKFVNDELVTEQPEVIKVPVITPTEPDIQPLPDLDAPPPTDLEPVGKPTKWW